MAMSRRCIPYTPRLKELSESTFALVTTAGVQLRSQEPFDLGVIIAGEKFRAM